MDWQYHRRYRYVSEHNSSRLKWRLVATASDSKEGVEEECYHLSYHHICTYQMFQRSLLMSAVYFLLKAPYCAQEIPPTPGPHKNSQKQMCALYINRSALTPKNQITRVQRATSTQLPNKQHLSPGSRNRTYNNIPKNQSHKYSSGDSTHKIRVILDRHLSPKNTASFCPEPFLAEKDVTSANNQQSGQLQDRLGR